MNRRQFFKAALVAGTSLAAGWQSVSAQGTAPRNLVLESQPKAKNAAISLKGMCTNDENPAHVNPLNPGWMYIMFGEWCWNMSHQYNCKWSLHLFDMVPAPQDVAKAMQHPSYDGWWLLLNEPDLAKITPKNAVKQIKQQMQAVLAADPNAKFCIGGGSQMNAPTTATPWFPQVWKLIPADLKSHIRAIHTHYYPQCEKGVTTDSIFSAIPTRNYVQSWRNWLDQNANDIHRELWVTEIGLSWNDALRADPRVPLYPLLVQDAMNGLAERWAWYSQSESENYVLLCDPSSGQLTATGTVFSASQPGIYPVKQK